MLTLTRNYRNTRPIAEFAASFYTGLPSGIPELPPSSARGERPFLMAHEKLHQTIEFIRNYENNHRDQSIGILLDGQGKVSSSTIGSTEDAKPGTGLPQPRCVVTHRGMHIDFADPGIKLLTYWSAKGLEFDTVFLPELQEVTGDPQADDVRMRFYVMSSRAKKVLGLMYTERASRICPGASPADGGPQAMTRRLRSFSPSTGGTRSHITRKDWWSPAPCCQVQSDLLELAPQRLPLLIDPRSQGRW